MGQAELGEFGGTAGSDRPAEEAVAVAGAAGPVGSSVVDPEEERFPDAAGTLELAVTQVDYTIEGSGDEEYPVVHVLGRTPENQPEHIRVLGVEPYFYVPAEHLEQDPVEEFDAVLDTRESDRTGKRFESIRGDQLTKIIARTPRDVGQLRDEFPETYEADILFPNRFLIDYGIQSGIRVEERRLENGSLQVAPSHFEPAAVDADLRVMMVDIEVDDRRGFPEDGEEPIVCLASHDSYLNEYIAWLYNAPDGDVPPPEAVADHELLDETAAVDVRAFETENAMLDAFLEYVNSCNPDVLSGWNFEDFDAPYLLDRLDVLGMDSDRVSRVNEVWRSSGGWGGPNIKGRVVFDLLYAYQRTQFSELDSYRLDDVAAMELDVGKERYPGDIGDLWEEDPERLLEYNLRDVELCVGIDEKQDVVDFWNEVRKFVGCKLEDATTPGDAVDMYVLHKAYGKFALPTKGQQAGEDFEGGAVFDPITGVKEMVSVLDLASLYPSAMVTINASPETRVDPDAYDGETYVAPTGTHYRKEPDGIVREMVDELLEGREEKKAQRDEFDPGMAEYEQFDRQQAAVKVIMNCFTPDTDVLTPDGVRSITDLDVGDAVYSLDPETLEMQVKPVTETHAYPDYQGELVDIETSKIDFRVTPNHRMLVRKNETNGITEDAYRFVEAGELDRATNYELPHDWSMTHGDDLDTVDLTELADGDYEVWVRPSVHSHTFITELGWQPRRVPKADTGTVGYVFDAHEFENHREYLEDVCETSYVHCASGRKWIPRTYDGDDFLDLLAWFITEGNVYTSADKQFGDQYRGSATTVKIAQNARPVPDGGTTDHAAIGTLLDRMGFDAYSHERGHQFTSKLLGDVLTELCGGDSFEKQIPPFVFDLSERQKRRFLDTLIAGDGDRRAGSWRYTTSSERLRDDMLQLCAHLGLTASYNFDSGSWRIFVTENAKNSLRMHRSATRSRADDGVYCVTVADNHTLLAGRNGTFQFVGQSLYGTLGWDRFRLYDKENAAAVTAMGREVIEFTERAANELDKTVIYGDSVTGDRPVIARGPDERLRILPIEALFDRAVSLTDSAVLLTADGGPVGSTELPKERRKLSGWEALSVDENGIPEWQPIRQVIRHEPDKRVVKLQHEFGESITTHDHSYVVEGEDGLRDVPPEDVDEPLRVSGIPGLDTVESIDVYEMLDGYTREYEDGRSVGAENAITKTKRIHADREWVWFGHDHYEDIDSTVKVKRHIDLTGEDGRAFLRLLGAYIAAGSTATIGTTDSRVGASIAESRREWLAQLQDDYHRLFSNTTAPIVASDTDADTTVKLQMLNELAAVFFREFTGQTSRGKRVPSFVFHLPEQRQRLFMDALVAGDGLRESSRSSEGDAKRDFAFETPSRELAAGLSTLLTQRGTKHSLEYHNATESYTIRTTDSYRRGRDPVLTEVDHDGAVYDLDVAENANFVDGVGGIVLHNTDSVMLELGEDVSREAAIEQSFEIEDHINRRYDAFALEELNAEEHRFEIEFEKLYRRFFQSGRKKRYAGHIIWKEGKSVDDIDITGFEYKRSDIAAITKEVQQQVLEMIVTSEADVETLKAELAAYLHEVIEEYSAGEVGLEEIGIPGGIGKRLTNYETDTAHVRGSKYANLLLGTNFARGSKPMRLYIDRVDPAFFAEFKNEHPELFSDGNGMDAGRGLSAEQRRQKQLFNEFRANQDVICFEYADQIPAEFSVDYDKMLEKTLKGPIARIIEALDMSWDEIKSGQEQTGLGNFM